MRDATATNQNTRRSCGLYPLLIPRLERVGPRALARELKQVAARDPRDELALLHVWIEHREQTIGLQHAVEFGQDCLRLIQHVEDVVEEHGIHAVLGQPYGAI